MNICVDTYDRTYEAKKLKRIVQNDLGGVDDETMEKIATEIEDGLK